MATLVPVPVEMEAVVNNLLGEAVAALFTLSAPLLHHGCVRQLAILLGLKNDVPCDVPSG